MSTAALPPFNTQHSLFPLPLTPTPRKNLPLIFFLNYANHTEHNVIIFDGPTPSPPPPGRNPQFTTLSRLSRSVPPNLSETVPQMDHWIKFPPNLRGKRANPIKDDAQCQLWSLKKAAHGTITL